MFNTCSSLILFLYIGTTPSSGILTRQEVPLLISAYLIYIKSRPVTKNFIRGMVFIKTWDTQRKRLYKSD